MGGKTTEAEFAVSPSRVFMACKRAVAELGYAVVHTDSEAMILSFNTGRSMKSWAGQDLSASVIAGGGTTRGVVGGSLAKGGNPFGSGQVAAWGEKSALSRKFLLTVGRVLPTVPEPSTSGGTTSVAAPSVVDELVKLKGLLDRGVLSNAEFESLKHRLLS